MHRLRIISRISLVVSIVLLVAVVVGYLARSAEVSRERDFDLRSGSRISAARFRSMVDTVGVAARSNTDPQRTMTAFVASYPDVGVCVVDSEDLTCGGRGARPSETQTDAAQLEFNTATSSERNALPTVLGLDDHIQVTSIGDDLAVVLLAPANSFGGPGINSRVRTSLPDGVDVFEFASEQGVRQYVVEVEGLDQVFVTTTGPDQVRLPSAEQRFYLIVFVLALVLLVLSTAMLVVDQRNLIERASTDQLTKLPNRAEFEAQAADAVADAERTNRPLALMIFDLDGFKEINDTLGHHTGDELLETVAQRLRRSVRSSEIVARWGGDEFVVIMPAIGDAGIALRRATEVAHDVGGRTRLSSSPEVVRLRLSAGVAVMPDHATDLEGLLKAADLAMYRAKRERIDTALATPLDHASPAATPT